MRIQKLPALVLALLLLFTLAACARSGADTEPAAAPAQAADAAHAPITIMSGDKEYSGFIEYVRSIYPEINIEVVPYRGANTTQYMYDQLYTGHMPDIHATTQMFTAMTSTRRI